MTASVADRIRGGLVPAVPVPFRGDEIDLAALEAYARWMAAQPVAGVAVWAHTGRGPHLTADQRATVLQVWREALPERVIIAGAHDIGTAIAARRGHADALLIFPAREHAVDHHTRLSRELPSLAFYLYQAAGGVAYDDATLDAILDLPGILGIKVATLDSVMTFQRIARRMEGRPDRLLVTGEDRFLGYSLMLGARAALIGMGGALTDLQAALLESHRSREWERFMKLSAVCDRFAEATFTPPVEGYIRRMLWALAAERIIPAQACDDPWGPPLPEAERRLVDQAVKDARAAGA
ncbi:MAG: dihydrodipicolinate synthase family protein [Gemmatimonadales bacterium]